LHLLSKIDDFKNLTEFSSLIRSFSTLPSNQPIPLRCTSNARSLSLQA